MYKQLFQIETAQDGLRPDWIQKKYSTYTEFRKAFATRQKILGPAAHQRNHNKFWEKVVKKTDDCISSGGVSDVSVSLMILIAL